jgi:DNA-binding NarL/FixJ family response regulator
VDVALNYGEARVKLAVDHAGTRRRLESALAKAGIPIVEPVDGDASGLCVVAHLALATETARLAAVRADASRTPIIVCSPPAGARAVRRAVEESIDGLVWETDIEARLAVTVAAVVAGQVAVPRELWRRMERPELTNREKQVLGLVVMGLSNGEIAEKLYLTESTVKSHLSSGFRKLGVASRAEAARVITDPSGGLGTGILAITPTSSSGRSNRAPDDR